MPAKTTTRTRKPATSRKPSAAQTAAAEEKKALAAAARKAKVDAMAAVEEFEIETASQERAFEDLCTHYSEGNALLILAQAAQMGLKVRGLRDVGGFNTMKDRGRAIKKGSHQVFFIWGKKVERTNATAENATAETPAPAPATPAAGESETARKARSFYPIVGLFHLSQTEDLAKAQARWAAEKASKTAAAE
jgi:hypothetical protein